MRSEPSTEAGEADEADPARRIATKRVQTALTVAAAAVAVLGVSVAGTALVGTGTVAADGTADVDAGAASVTEADVEEADIVLEPAETEVSVPVELDDGETVTLRIRSAGDASTAFLVTEEATVEDGEASASFNLSAATHGDRATLTVRGNEALDEPVAREVLVVDEGTGGGLDVEAPGFGIVAGGLAVLVVALAARRRD